MGDALRINVSTTHSLLLMARLGHSTFASTTTKRKTTRISLPHRECCRGPTAAVGNVNSSPRGDDFESDDDQNNPTWFFLTLKRQTAVATGADAP